MDAIWGLAAHPHPVSWWSSTVKTHRKSFAPWLRDSFSGETALVTTREEEAIDTKQGKDMIYKEWMRERSSQQLVREVDITCVAERRRWQPKVPRTFTCLREVEVSPHLGTRVTL